MQAAPKTAYLVMDIVATTATRPSALRLMNALHYLPYTCDLNDENGVDAGLVGKPFRQDSIGKLWHGRTLLDKD